MSVLKFLKQLENHRYLFIWQGKTLLYEGWCGVLKGIIKNDTDISQITYLGENDIEIIIK